MKTIEKHMESAKILSSDFEIERLTFSGYELVLDIKNSKVGLHAIISIHNTSLGKSLGGTRLYPYESFHDALEDVLRLSKGMTYKNAIPELGFGGAKSVIIADPKKGKTRELLLAFGEAVDSLKGRYICAKDVGITDEDLMIIREKTPYVIGLSHKKSSGNPSCYTAWGTYKGIQAVLQKICGNTSVEGKTIALQGLGSVGEILLDTLFWNGANLIVADVDDQKLEIAKAKYAIKTVSPEQIYDKECDIFAPCAMGAILNPTTIPRLRCKGIAGAANNQLLTDSDADLLEKRGIVYAPDFVINGGGAINVAQELEVEGYNPKIARDKTNHIYDSLLALFEIAENNGISTQKAALQLADYKIRYGIGKRQKPICFHHKAASTK